MQTVPRPPLANAALANGSVRALLLGMRSVGLKILKNKLSEYVRIASGGETVLVTDRDRVVAELIPPREGRSAMLHDAKLAEAMRQGWVTAPAMVSHEVPAHVPVAPLRQLLDELSYDRGDR